MEWNNPLTVVIALVTVVTSIMAFNNQRMFARWKFNPWSIKHDRQYGRFISYGFLHADYIHLFINLMVFFSFGDVVERVYHYGFPGYGWLLYLILYFSAIMISVIPSYFKNRSNPEYNAVGASGAVSAIVFASILFAPAGKIYIFFIPIGIPAFIFGFVYLIYSYIMARKSQGNIGHDAHFWGAVYGILFTLACKPAFAVHFWNEVMIFMKGVF